MLAGHDSAVGRERDVVDRRLVTDQQVQLLPASCVSQT